MNVSQKDLDDLFSAIVKTLTSRISDDLATGSEYSAAIALLKNNNVTVTPETNESMNQLKEQLNATRRGGKVVPFDRSEAMSDVQLKLGGGSGE